MIQNGPKTIQNDLKIARKRSENYTLSDGPISSDCFESFGLIWNLIITLILHMNVEQQRVLDKPVVLSDFLRPDVFLNALRQQTARDNRRPG